MRSDGILSWAVPGFSAASCRSADAGLCPNNPAAGPDQLDLFARRRRGVLRTSRGVPPIPPGVTKAYPARHVRLGVNRQRSGRSPTTGNGAAF